MTLTHLFLLEHSKRSSSPTVIPLLLISCQCGGADKVFSELFIDLDTGRADHLISYNTEGQGEDKVGGSSPHLTLML